MNERKRWFRTGPASVVLLAIAAILSAYPIPPQTLWNLVQDAELVVLARVEAEGEMEFGEPDDPESWRPARARLAIDERLKGEVDGTIEVSYSPNLICPAPARFVEGRTVLAFLARDPESGEWTVPQLSYGTLYPRERDLPLFRRLIRRALTVQEAKGPQPPPVDWLVEAAEHRATRWHGLYELAFTLDEVHSFYDRGSTREDRRSKLDAEQRARIARGFAAEPSADLTFVQTLGVVGMEPDEEFDRTAMGLIEWGLRQETAPYWMSDAIELTLRRFGDRGVGKRLAALGEHSWERSIESLRDLWTKGKDSLALPDIEPLVVEEEDDDEPEVRGVGGRTPS